MAIRVYKPTTNARRNMSVNLHAEVTKRSPEKSLLRPLKKSGGRNNQGKITVRGRGGGHKRRYRMIDFRRIKDDMNARVIGIEYDPNRSCHIALLEYEDGTRRYILSPRMLKDGEAVVSSMQAIEPKPGNCMPLKHIPTGLTVHNIEFEPRKGGKICRSAGAGARLSNKEGRWATLVLPSGEIRQVSVECRATIGQLGNTDHQNVKLGKAGRNRWLGRKPKVRGVAKDHACHPLGGGEGRSKGGREPASASGTKSKGGRTRPRGRWTDARILRRRKSKRYGQLKL
ncbi:MAG: 50S ribosomal protein L2 [Phycisphaerales bacterium]|nr:50S ribosomal protein L2 [Phycisphaerae bacterium]NNF44695.1 50S ribosomal protein L2 [Phycisphaerales bacterium]NNM25258.1 50S ribosomal protein L2 [Phycisphaerales bacterium]